MSGDKFVINFTRGVPADESFPIKEITAATQSALEKYGTTILQYGKAYGFQPLREWFAARQEIAVDNVLTANSTLQVIDFLCHQLLQPGDVAFTELPTYDRTVTLLRRHKATIVGIPLEDDGPNIEVLESELKKHVPKFFYIIPDFQNPTGLTYSLAKREKLAELAEKYGFWIIEDAPYRPLRFRGKEQTSIFKLNPTRTLHLFSFAKIIGPGLRVCAIHGDAQLLAKMAKFAEDTYICPVMFSMGAAYEFCQAGHFPAQVDKLKALYAPRLQACLDAITQLLPNVDVTRPQGGFFLGLTLPEGVTTAAVMEKAKAYNLNLAPGQAFFPNGGGERFLRLPYCALSPEQIHEGISRLAATLKDVQAK